jgi:hypothetical protein
MINFIITDYENQVKVLNYESLDDFKYDLVFVFIYCEEYNRKKTYYNKFLKKFDKTDLSIIKIIYFSEQLNIMRDLGIEISIVNFFDFMEKEYYRQQDELEMNTREAE